MQIAILSDIHSNIYALQEVIKDIKNRDIEVVLNLGDMFYGPIEPKATYEIIRENKFINICGNQDREILEASLDQLEKNPTLRYTYENLGEEVLYWIQDLQFEKIIGGTYYMIHGTYFDDSQYLLEDISNGEVTLRRDEEIIKLTDNIETPFIFCGHSHLPRVHKLNTGQIVINPGSVGLQAYEDEFPIKHKMQNHTPDAAYTILTVEENQYSIEQVRVAYDYEKAAKKAEDNRRPDWAYALRTGKVLEK
ncbi:metallophosphoesterase family protein [Halarcobacter bivalviorum]|uniref:Metallophosphatase family protein n=1 Tax=Halarcobacter bivalviorum TaxID=663364 RepID=A0AAX2ABH4_9BACT|nr:metallophosphoesterase family protein [Halarcobacter bivalviorum]AXH12426.1 metallophosphoesterase [Halarcobacter bivalviorum]RXK10648.1 metallophosphatase family protein [Halarcobacter bivalviorum]